MRRSPKELAVIQRRVREFERDRRNSLASNREDPATFAGKFRKRSPRDCGRARCLCCHREKVFAVPARKELAARAAAQEQLADLSDVFE